MLGVFLAAYLAAAPLDTAHAAVLYVITHGEDAVGCDPARIGCDPGMPRKAAANASIRKLGTIGGDVVILAQVMDPNICGAQNCPYYAIRITSGTPRVLLSTFGIAEHNGDQAKPLPSLVVLAHDSAMITDEVTYAYRNGSYVAVSAARIRGDNHGRKPDAVVVHFPPGASSAPLSGAISTGWYDVYAFDARNGQRIVVNDVRSSAKVSLSLSGPYGPNTWHMSDLRAGAPFTLPRTGTYRLQISNDSSIDVPYSLTLAIR
jgi:hypothetical protein